ncbi:DUF599 domain-containing protein [Aliidiomarina minuta]|uniref:DUF599 domain-containing protein n=1 Tax=Aliidiomarina minuta TaxID=880057 RepID=A0A432W7S8_9GAMM|nr:DUF599 domain-containing protein [Aliidiomarina minuta]RUO26069.1 DUF599 domain-containing protein [Aliidiomarina minuta]
MRDIPLIDLIAIGWFLLLWVGYSLFAKKRARHIHCLSSILRTLRVDWMYAVTHKDQHIADAALIGNVERNVTFFASSTILVLAGVLTVLASSEQFVRVIDQLPFTVEQSPTLVLFKLAGMATIMVFAFFKFTWSIRQFGFVSVLLGMAPNMSRSTVSEEERDRYARNTAKVLDQAGHEYNYGLRAYYFALAYLCWFANPWFFITASAVVVGVLYRREYRSRVLRALLATKGYEPGPMPEHERLAQHAAVSTQVQDISEKKDKSE